MISVDYLILPTVREFRTVKSQVIAFSILEVGG